MGESSPTCWSVVGGAAAGRGEDRELFARRYLPMVRAYLADRWRGTVWIRELEDAVQEVFLDCFRSGGALGVVDRERGGFRAFLYGVVRNVALRAERRRTNAAWALRKWLTEPDLAGVRDPGALATLPEEERAKWEALWAEVRTVFRDAEVR